MKYGFTIIELIVVITIMLIFMGAGFMSFNTISANAELKKHTSFITDAVQKTKEHAQNRYIDASATACESFYGYRLSLYTTSYHIQLLCYNAGVLGVPWTESKFLPTNIEIGDTSGRFQVFTYPYGKTTGHWITVKNTNTNKCSRVNITIFGTNDIVDNLPCAW